MKIPLRGVSMKVAKHDSIKTLKKEMRLKVNAEARDRIRAVIFAMKGHTAQDVAERMGYARSWVFKWVSRYSDEGWGGLWDRPRSGQPKKLTEEQQEEFEKIIQRGPLAEEKLARYRAKDFQRILRERFNAEYSLSGVKDLLHRLGYSSIKPRPKNPKNDPEEMALWKRKAPEFVKEVKKNISRKKSKYGSRMRVDLDRRAS
jgi:transposase